MEESKCPYSKNGKCKSCKVISIECDGSGFAKCSQYLIEAGQTTPQKLIEEANTFY